MAETIAQGSKTTGHNIVAIGAFELIGVSLMAIIADSSKSLGNIILMLMIAFLFIWFTLYGSKFLGGIINNVGNLTKGKG